MTTKASTTRKRRSTTTTAKKEVNGKKVPVLQIENIPIGKIKPDFGFIINKYERLECDYYFICEKCLTIKLNDCNHECEERETSTSLKFLCGAFAVQEFLKRIRNLEAVDNYKINL